MAHFWHDMLGLNWTPGQSHLYATYVHLPTCRLLLWVWGKWNDCLSSRCLSSLPGGKDRSGFSVVHGMLDTPEVNSFCENFYDLCEFPRGIKFEWDNPAHPECGQNPAFSSGSEVWVGAAFLRMGSERLWAPAPTLGTTLFPGRKASEAWGRKQIKLSGSNSGHPRHMYLSTSHLECEVEILDHNSTFRAASLTKMTTEALHTRPSS